MNTPKAVTVERLHDLEHRLALWCQISEPSPLVKHSSVKEMLVESRECVRELLAARITLQKLQAARDALKAGAMCLEATALSHRHPSMSKGATKTDLNDAMRAGNKASDDKLLHAAALRALGEV